MANPEHTDIFDEIRDERAYQDRKWGGPKHDDKRSIEELIAKYAAETQAYEQRKAMIKVAALAVAMIEKIDRTSAPRPTVGARHLPGLKDEASADTRVTRGQAVEILARVTDQDNWWEMTCEYVLGFGEGDEDLLCPSIYDVFEALGVPKDEFVRLTE